jgi:hypothetical protein
MYKELLLHSPPRGGPIPFYFFVLCFSGLLDNLPIFGHNINSWVGKTEAHIELFETGTIIETKVLANEFDLKTTRFQVQDQVKYFLHNIRSIRNTVTLKQ